MLDYQERVVEERDVLSTKIDKLRKFTHGVLFTTLSSKERGYLMRQYLVMAAYLDILNERITAFEE